MYMYRTLANYYYVASYVPNECVKFLTGANNYTV